MTKSTSVQEDIRVRSAKIREALKDRTYSKVALAAGLHVNTVRNIATNAEQTFSVSTVDILFKYLFPTKA